MSSFTDIVLAFLSRFGERDLYDVLKFSSAPDAAPVPGRDLARFAELVPPALGSFGTLVDQREASISFSNLQDTVGAYLEGDSTAPSLRRILQPKVDMLDQLRDADPVDTRIWLHFEARELEELPWELLTDRPRTDRRTVYFRGIPTCAVPTFEVTGAPRVLFLHDGTEASIQLCLHLTADAADVQPATVAALERARAYDVLHVVGYASVGSAYESVLGLADGERLPASELGRLLRGGRTGLLLLSVPPAYPPERAAECCRAFMHFGQENLQCSIVAPVGPLHGSALDFWAPFHAALARTASVERALHDAREQVGVVPVVFFLRHRSARVFRRVSSESTVESPVGASPPTGALAARHAILRDTLAALEAVDRGADPHRPRLRDLEAFRTAHAELMALETRLGRPDDGDDNAF
jgi:hypothetical protein